MGSPRQSVAGVDLVAVRRRVLATVRSLLADATLEPDADGDIPIPLAGSSAYVQVGGLPVFARTFVGLAQGVAESPALLLALHRINATLPLGRLVLTGGAVFAAVDVLADPLVPAHLQQAWAVVGGIVEQHGPAVKALAHDGATVAQPPT